jgi:hypothetical protein
MKRSPARVLVVIGAAIVLMIGGAVAYAQIPSADGTIRACYDNSGSLRVLDEGASCPKNWKGPISWNQKGQPGADGADGTNGVSGYEKVVGPFDKVVPATSPPETGVAAAHCPDGKVATGGGGSMFFLNPSGTVAAAGDITGSAPFDDNGDGNDDSWSIAYGRFDGTSMVPGQHANGNVYVLCAAVTP